MNPMHATTPNTKPNTKVLTPGVIATPPGTIEVPSTAHRLAPWRAVRLLRSVVWHEHLGLSMRGRRIRARVAIAAALAVLGGCLPARVPPTAPPVLVALASHPPLVDDGDPATLAAALRASVAYYARLPRDRVLEIGGERVAVEAMQDALASLAAFVDGRPALFPAEPRDGPAPVSRRLTPARRLRRVERPTVRQRRQAARRRGTALARRGVDGRHSPLDRRASRRARARAARESPLRLLRP